MTTTVPAEPRFTHGPFTLRRSTSADIPSLLEFHARNAARFEPLSPRRSADAQSEAFWERRLAAAQSQFEQDRGVAMHLYHADGRALGFVNLMNLVRGAFQSCDMGYGLDGSYEGQGVMYWAVTQALDHAFTTLGLHRVQANHLPENERSARLLARLGFRREGYAERFLLIDGRWRDHVLNALVYDAWRPRAGEEFMLELPAR